MLVTGAQQYEDAAEFWELLHITPACTHTMLNGSR